jgi:hypothetical protein
LSILLTMRSSRFNTLSIVRFSTPASCDFTYGGAEAGSHIAAHRVQHRQGSCTKLKERKKKPRNGRGFLRLFVLP